MSISEPVKLQADNDADIANLKALWSCYNILFNMQNVKRWLPGTDGLCPSTHGSQGSDLLMTFEEIGIILKMEF